MKLIKSLAFLGWAGDGSLSSTGLRAGICESTSSDSKCWRMLGVIVGVSEMRGRKVSSNEENRRLRHLDAPVNFCFVSSASVLRCCAMAIAPDSFGSMVAKTPAANLISPVKDVCEASELKPPGKSSATRAAALGRSRAVENDEY